jgi:hypothetical protein
MRGAYNGSKHVYLVFKPTLSILIQDPPRWPHDRTWLTSRNVHNPLGAAARVHAHSRRVAGTFEPWPGRAIDHDAYMGRPRESTRRNKPAGVQNCQCHWIRTVGWTSRSIYSIYSLILGSSSCLTNWLILGSFRMFLHCHNESHISLSHEQRCNWDPA